MREREKGGKNVISSLCFLFIIHLSLLELKLNSFSRTLCSPLLLFLSHSASSEVPNRVQLRPGDIKGYKMVNSSPVWRHFDLWCFISICLLLFTFQSSQTAGQCILSRVYSCVVLWERKRCTYFILSQTGNSSVIYFFIYCFSNNKCIIFITGSMGTKRYSF